MLIGTCVLLLLSPRSAGYLAPSLTDGILVEWRVMLHLRLPDVDVTGLC